ncbi:MAG: dihydrodipicolinate synthase family protein [Candidatus Rokuibacteriota bacterium]
MELIRGIVAAWVLPMTDDFDVDWAELRRYVRWLTPQGPTAVAMNMDAGEGPSLSLEERVRVIRESREAMDEPFGALDALTREQMRIDLEALWLRTGKTVLFITHSIDEAVLLAERVMVMSARPGRIERAITVSLSRPRGLEARQHPVFADLTRTITDIFLARGILHRTPASPEGTQARV